MNRFNDEVYNDLVEKIQSWQFFDKNFSLEMTDLLFKNSNYDFFINKLVKHYKKELSHDEVVEFLYDYVHRLYNAKINHGAFRFAHVLLVNYPELIDRVDFYIQSKNNNNGDKYRNFLIVHENDQEKTEKIFTKHNIEFDKYKVELDNFKCCLFISDEEFEGLFLNSPYHTKIRKDIRDNNINNSLYHYKSTDKIFYLDTEFSKNYRPDTGIDASSTWEANFSRILEYLKIEYEYEPERYVLDIPDYIDKTTLTDYDIHFTYTYLPDFRIGKNRFIELKGFWDNKSVMRVNGFIEKYQDFELFLIDQDVYTQLKKKYKNLISNWEDDGVGENSKNTETINVVGITLPERSKYVKKLVTDDQLTLERDAENQYDKHAIKVVDKNGNHLGFVAKDWAKIISPKLDLGFRFNVLFKVIDNKVMKVEIKTDYIPDKTYDFLM